MKKTISVFALAIFLSAITVSATLITQEKAPGKEFATVKEVAAFTYVCIPHKGPFTEIPGVIGQLMQAIQEQKIAPAGTMIGVYYNDPQMVKPEDLAWEMGFPVSPQVEVKAPLEKKKWEYSPVISAIHKGPYEETGNTYTKMFHWMQENGLTQIGPVLERYLTMPGPNTKPEDNRSELWVPFQK